MDCEHEADHSALQNLCVTELPNGDVSGMDKTSRKISQGNACLQMAHGLGLQATAVANHHDVSDCIFQLAGISATRMYICREANQTVIACNSQFDVEMMFQLSDNLQQDKARNFCTLLGSPVGSPPYATFIVQGFLQLSTCYAAVVTTVVLANLGWSRMFGRWGSGCFEIVSS